MKPTLFMIPSSWFDGPLLYGWLVIGLVIMAYLYFRKGDTKEIFDFLPMYAIIAAVVYFLLPRIQVEGINPENPSGELINVGLAIRGWGLCLLSAMGCAVGLIYVRCRQIGFNFDKILSLTFWMIVSGILGARLFYIIQKWEQFSSNSIGDLFTKLVDATKGGMVVYGSLIGGMIGAGVFFWISRIDWRKSMDVVAPAMVLGLAIGRIGCLMNGCCFGGVCDTEPGIQFPAGSPPYLHQLFSGELIGLSTEADSEDPSYPLKVLEVVDDSIADKEGVVVGDQIGLWGPAPEYFRAVHQQKFQLDQRYNFEINIKRVDEKNKAAKRPSGIPIQDLPSHSLKIHPTQIYSAIAAVLLMAFLWFYYPYRKFDGEVFALLIIIYPIARFLLEIIRADEAGQLNTKLTISQIVSMISIAVGFAVWAWCRNYIDKPQETIIRS